MTTRRWWWRISLSPPSQIGHFLIIPPLADLVDRELRFLLMIQGGSVRSAEPASSTNGKRCRNSGPQRAIKLRSAQVIQLIFLEHHLCDLRDPKPIRTCAGYQSPIAVFPQTGYASAKH